MSFGMVAKTDYLGAQIWHTEISPEAIQNKDGVREEKRMMINSAGSF